MLVSVYTCQNATLLEITCRGLFLMKICITGLTGNRKRIGIHHSKVSQHFNSMCA